MVVAQQKLSKDEASFVRGLRTESPRKSLQRPPRDFWESWPARLAVIAAFVLALTVAAMLDPEPQPTLVKMGEIVVHAAVNISHGQ